MELLVVNLLNGLSYGLMLFMLSAGLTLIYGMMGVLNFAHTSFYMLGAYAGFSLSHYAGFWGALVLAPLLVGVLGALFARFFLRRVQGSGHVAELLLTFALSLLLLEVVHLVWGRGSVDYRVPAELQGPLFSVYGVAFPLYRGFMVLVALLMFAVLWAGLVLTRTGLVVRAAWSHPHMVEVLGHDLPRLTVLVFAAGCALAALAGVVAGNTHVTEPGMAASVGALVFVTIVVGGVGSLTGALAASLLIGVLQTVAVGIDTSLLSLAQAAGWQLPETAHGHAVLSLRASQLAPLLPYLLMVLVLVLRPRGLAGTRDA